MDSDDILYIVYTTPEIMDHWISLNLPIRDDIIRIYMNRHKMPSCVDEQYEYLAKRLKFPTNAHEYDVFRLTHTVVSMPASCNMGWSGRWCARLPHNTQDVSKCQRTSASASPDRSVASTWLRVTVAEASSSLPDSGVHP